MKSKNIFRAFIATATFLYTSQFAFAKTSLCPSLDELKNMQGFWVEYPLNLDISSKEPLSWLVAQTQVNPKKHLMNTWIISPVKPSQGEYPNHAALQMIDTLEPLNHTPECDDTLSQNSSVCACAYWNPFDGSLATFLATEFKAKHAPTIASQLQMNAKIMSKFKNLQK